MGAAAPPPVRPSTATATAKQTVILAPGDIELRLSPVYGAIVLFAGVVFTLIGILPFGKAGPKFHTICLLAGPVLIVIGIVMLRSRKVIVTMTSTALHLQGAVIPWGDIESFQRIREARNYWIGINLKTKRTDLGKMARGARAVLNAMGSRGTDFDYIILETDLPRSGLWFIDECQR